jgi:hypothetical protein
VPDPYSYRLKVSGKMQFTFTMSRQEKAILEELSRLTELSQAEVMRRLLHFAAKRCGIRKEALPVNDSEMLDDSLDDLFDETKEAASLIKDRGSEGLRGRRLG